MTTAQTDSNQSSKPYQTAAEIRRAPSLRKKKDNLHTRCDVRFKLMESGQNARDLTFSDIQKVEGGTIFNGVTKMVGEIVGTVPGGGLITEVAAKAILIANEYAKENSNDKVTNLLERPLRVFYAMQKGASSEQKAEIDQKIQKLEEKYRQRFIDVRISGKQTESSVERKEFNREMTAAALSTMQAVVFPEGVIRTETGEIDRKQFQSQCTSFLKKAEPGLPAEELRRRSSKIYSDYAKMSKQMERQQIIDKNISSAKQFPEKPKEIVDEMRTQFKTNRDYMPQTTSISSNLCAKVAASMKK